MAKGLGCWNTIPYETGKAPPRIDGQHINIPSPEVNMTFKTKAPDQVIHSVEAAQENSPHPEEPIKAVTLFFWTGMSVVSRTKGP